MKQFAKSILVGLLFGIVIFFTYHGIHIWIPVVVLCLLNFCFREDGEMNN